MHSEYIIPVVVLLCVAQCGHGKQYLMRTSPGGDGLKPAGVWAGQLDTDDAGAADDLFTHGFSSLDGVSSSTSGLEVSVLSKDPEGRGLLVVTKSLDGQASLALGTGLCGSDKPTVLLHHIKLTDGDNPYLSDSECGYKCGWGPVALYDGEVYFVLTAVFGKIYNQLQRRMQIRKLVRNGECEQIIQQLGPRDTTKAEDFPVLQCSELVATLFSDDYVKPLPRPTRWSTQHLAVGKYKGTIHFYLQLLDSSGGTGNSRIILAHAASGDSLMQTLTSSVLDDVYTGSLNVHGLGSVDYRQGTLCWSAGDTLRCSLHEPGDTSLQAVIVLPAGEALAKGICKVSTPEASLQRAITGVAIAESSKKQLAVYFGCYAQVAGSGGVGMVTLSNNGLLQNLYAVTSGGRKVYASHVMMMSGLSAKCPLDEDDVTTTAAADDVTTAAGDDVTGPSQTPTPSPCTCSSGSVHASLSASPAQLNVSLACILPLVLLFIHLPHLELS